MIEKFQASILGYAIGDALASPVEDTFRSASEGEDPIVFYTKASLSHPLSHLEPGQFSDETQVMLVLASSLVAQRSFNSEDVAGRFVDWYHTQKKRTEWRFPGNTVLNACRKLAAGTSITQSGFFSAGVNATCRTVPYALAYYNSPDRLKKALEASCKITHTDPKVVWAAQALAVVIEMGLKKSDFSVRSILNRVCEKTQSNTQELVKKAQIIRDGFEMEPRRVLESLGNSGYCFESFACALYWFLKAKDNFDSLMMCTANSGGDNDAIAAMAGAMYGAWFGLSKVSSKWLEPLERCNELKQLGYDLYRLTQ
jgi:ADP-ribosylglycohydrolase